MQTKWWMGVAVASALVGCSSGDDGTSAGTTTSGGTTSATTTTTGSGQGGDGGSGGATSGTGGATSGTGGATGNGGSGGSGGSNPANFCGAAGLYLCDDFEGVPAGGPPAAANWTVESFQNEGSLNIDDTVAHSGAKSVHVLGQWNDSFRYIMFTTAKPFPAPDNTFYARVFIRSKTEMGDGHSTYFGGYQTDWQRTMRVGFNHFMLEANLTHPNGEWELQSGDWVNPENGVQFVPGQWHCVEAMFDGKNHEIRVWFEGQEVPKLHTTDWGANLSDWSPQYQVARFGFETYHGEQAELWYDDVAIGAQPIGCGK